MDSITDMANNIKACRTCGIHFVTPSKHQLKHLFQSCQEHPEVMLIRLELAQWNVEVLENDGFPQYVCNSCIHKFEQVFHLRTACINAQNEFRKFYAVSNGNITNINIKAEIPDGDEEPAICDFIYVDELSDGDYDGATPFNIPHIPIKEEVIEAAAVPTEDLKKPINVVESASRILMPIDPPHSHEANFVTQNGCVTDSQTSAILPMSLDVVECNLCHQISPNREHHKLHMQVVHDIKDLECHICGKEFKNSTSARLKFHIKWHSLNRQIRCNLCGLVCHSKDALNAHKRTNHRKINCKICRKGVLAKKIKSHLRQHEMQQTYPCEYCAEAFATEVGRETHIWQIHAAEDNSATGSMIDYQTYYNPRFSDNILNVTQERNICQEPQEAFLYKYICAHCEQRFMKQMDLEIHVKEEHCGIRLTTAVIGGTVRIDKTSDTAQNCNENAMFEKYDSDNEKQIQNSNDPPINLPALTPEIIHNTTSASFVTQNEFVQNDGIKLTSSSSCDEDCDTESETETSILSTYAQGDLNTFACAKCSETFAAIEQLREHYEQHLLVEQQKTRTSPTKSKFQCIFCEKCFDLKFRLNRHIKKHKNYAPL